MIDPENPPSRLRPITAEDLPPIDDTALRLQPVNTGAPAIADDSARLRPLSYHERQALPIVAPGAPAGSAASAEARLARIEDQKANPWGSPENHPGALGRLAHIGARIGNIAGDIVAPATMRMIPGTDLNRAGREEEAREGLNAAEGKEETERHNKAEETVAGERNANTATKNQQDFAAKLRKFGLTVDETGEPKPIQYEQMSPTEQAAYDLKQAQGDAAEARSLADKIKADPDSQQNKAIRDRLRIMAKNAATAAGKLGLDQKKFLADYYGTDEDGKPLAGVEKTEEGTPVGPKIAGENKQQLAAFNKDYVKPSEDIERSYQLYQEALAAYKRGDQKTGAATMLALSQHLGTTFGQVKGSRMNRDLIQEHKDAIGIGDRIERFVNGLKRGDQLSASQMDEFGTLISNFRKLSWQTAVKEGKRGKQQIDFLPKDLEGDLNQKTETAPAGGTGGGSDFENFIANRKKPQ